MLRLTKEETHLIGVREHARERSPAAQLAAVRRRNLRDSSKEKRCTCLSGQDGTYSAS
jgi:hypothetical protein